VIPTEIGTVVQYRITAADAFAFTANPHVARLYEAGDVLPAVVLATTPRGRCDLHVFLHGPATAYVPSVPEHYAADGSFARVPGR
jgi:hypothetical protein